MADTLIRQQLEELKNLGEEESRQLSHILNELAVLELALKAEEESFTRMNRQKRSIMANNFKLQVDIDDKEQELEHIEHSYAQLMDKMSQLAREKREYDDRTKQIQMEMQAELQNHLCYITSIQQFFESESDTGRELGEWQKIVEDKSRNLEQLNQQVHQTEVELSQNNERLDHLNQEYKLLLEQKQSIEEQNCALTREMSAMESRVTSMERTRANKTREIKTLDQEYERSQKSLKALQEQVEEQENKRLKVEQLKHRVLQEYQTKENRLRSLQKK